MKGCVLFTPHAALLRIATPHSCPTALAPIATPHSRPLLPRLGAHINKMLNYFAFSAPVPGTTCAQLCHRPLTWGLLTRDPRASTLHCGKCNLKGLTTDRVPLKAIPSTQGPQVSRIDFRARPLTVPESRGVQENPGSAPIFHSAYPRKMGAGPDFPACPRRLELDLELDAGELEHLDGAGLTGGRDQRAHRRGARRGAYSHRDDRRRTGRLRRDRARRGDRARRHRTGCGRWHGARGYDPGGTWLRVSRAARCRAPGRGVGRGTWSGHSRGDTTGRWRGRVGRRSGRGDGLGVVPAGSGYDASRDDDGCRRGRQGSHDGPRLDQAPERSDSESALDDPQDRVPAGRHRVRVLVQRELGVALTSAVVQCLLQGTYASLAAPPDPLGHNCPLSVWLANLTPCSRGGKSRSG